MYIGRFDVPGYGINRKWITIILNHSRGWGGKPIGSSGDSRVAEISLILTAPVFLYPESAGGQTRQMEDS
jgi:hypothetical protein